MYAAVNIGIRDRGEAWMKCANCGRLARMDVPEFEGDGTVCSPRCFDEFAASLTEGF